MMNQECEGKRQSQVKEQLDILEKRIMGLNEGINNLEERLEGVLISPNPACGGDKNEEARTLCKLAEALKNQNDRINNANMSIRNIIQRCDL
uniref:Uncharacterized protein n=1 Tax=viral metagenome TaxID=1070528 RepID=A0A6M3LPP2_9ZZZZ